MWKKLNQDKDIDNIEDIKEWLGEDNLLGIDVFNKKYRHNNETLDEWLDRVSGNDEKLRKIIKDKKFLFGGRVLTNRGIEGSGNFYNCFSHGFVEDSMNDIMDTAKELALTYKIQGGQGISLSKLRPRNAQVGEHYTSDGIIPFMEMYDSVTSCINQGSARRGALMISLDAMHGDIQEFITIKSNETKVTKANLSLEIDDEFMEAVDAYYKNGATIVCHKVREYSGHIIEYDITPIEIFKLMIKNNYDWAEPSALYTNRFRNYNLMEFVKNYIIETCNPCGEQPLIKKGCCNLASINLYEFVKNKYKDDAKFDWEDFKETIRIAIEALDVIIDENAERLPDELHEYKENAVKYRNIGLGVFGYANMLMALGMTYGSEDAILFTRTLFNYMFSESVIFNSELASTKGTFPEYSDKIWESKIIKNHFFEDEISTLKERGLRNCSLLSIAPSGSISQLFQMSGGTEPEFALSYERKTDNLKDKYTVYSKSVNDYKEAHNIIEDNIKLPSYFITSSEIHYLDRIKTQSTIQNSVDTAISSTVNLPNNISIEEVEDLYLQAWKMGLKGITIYRSGCKREGILTTNKIEENVIEEKLTNATPKDVIPRGYVIDVADDVIGKKRKIISGCGSLHVGAFTDPTTGELLETFLNKGSTGGCSNLLTGLSRMISLALRSGVDIHSIVDQLNSTGACPSYAIRSATKHDTSKGACCPMAIGNALLEMYNEAQEELFDGDWEIPEPVVTVNEEVEKIKKIIINDESKCPICGAKLRFEGGCSFCGSCGFSRCD